MERSDKPLLDWLLLKHADTPKTRAKHGYWRAGVSVRAGSFDNSREDQRPGDTLELQARHATTLACEGGRQIHPRVFVAYLDAVRRDRQQRGRPDLRPGIRIPTSALSILPIFWQVTLGPRP